MQGSRLARHPIVPRRVPAWTLACAALCLLAAAPKAHATDEECKRIMSGRIKICAEDCQRRALAATDIKDPNNNVLFFCIKKCALDMTMQRQVCQ
jgi:hypothetical protein